MMAIALVTLVASVAAAIIVRDRRRIRALRESSLSDPVTGLASHAYLLNRVEQALARAQRHGTGVVALEIDVDGFAVVNDRFGHANGDRLLFEVGSRLASCLRREDTLARSGGDEFIALLEDVANIDAAVAVVQRVEQAFDEPFVIDAETVSLRVSIGVAQSDRGDEPASELLYRANLALRKAKERGRARCHIFDAHNAESARQRLRLESDLRDALARDELRLHFQPEVDLVTGAVLGVEALVRWRHPERGLLLPGEFVPLAEDVGLIDEIGAWVLREATCAAMRLRKVRAVEGDLAVNVNVSRRQLADGSRLVRDVWSALDESGLPPGALVLEVTETALVENLAVALDPIRRLRADGIRVAMDDFGTGYSSLAALRNMPVDILKLDRRFVAGIVGPEDEAIVQAVVRLAAALGLVVTAEGVELEEQRQMLTELGCRRGQGYHLGRPVLEARLTEMLGAWPKTKERSTLRVV